jgi:uncharacterized protein YndB with AHSA1/START domain
MTTRNNPAPLPAERELVITRVYDAPRELVWRAFTESDRLAQWWGPQGLEMLVTRLDLRPGGVFHYSMRSPEGQILWGRFLYRDIRAPERLVFVSSFSDEEGNITRAPFSPTWPLEVLNTLTLTESSDGRTTVTLRGGPINTTQEELETFWNAQDSLTRGFAGTFDQLAAYLSQETKGA